MIKRYHNILFLLVIIILGCEKDDICIEGSENTSRITIGFIDYENKGDKEINLNSIRGIGLDSIIEGFNGNNLKLPLMSNTNKTKYVFEYNETLDTLIIQHQTIHKYLNRSCGYISNFILKSDTEISKNHGWIREVSIKNDSIFNELQTNILIHY
tara:strand:- start:166 stop:630 length:465 start_codon:yes stop_codon:yes gene_type:complete